MRRLLVLLSVVAVGSSALLLTACGGSDKSATVTQTVEQTVSVDTVTDQTTSVDVVTNDQTQTDVQTDTQTNTDTVTTDTSANASVLKTRVFNLPPSSVNNYVVFCANGQVSNPTNRIIGPNSGVIIVGPANEPNQQGAGFRVRTGAYAPGTRQLRVTVKCTT